MLTMWVKGEADADKHLYTNDGKRSITLHVTSKTIYSTNRADILIIPNEDSALIPTKLETFLGERFKNPGRGWVFGKRSGINSKRKTFYELKEDIQTSCQKSLRSRVFVLSYFGRAEYQ